MRFLLAGVEVRASAPSRGVYWMDQWERVGELVRAGLLRQEHHGPATFGASSFIVPEGTPESGEPTDRERMQRAAHQADRLAEILARSKDKTQIDAYRKSRADAKALRERATDLQPGRIPCAAYDALLAECEALAAPYLS